MALRIRKNQLRAVCAKLRSFLAAGDTDHQACERLGLSWNDYEELKAKMMDMEGEKVRNQTPEQVYVTYLMAQDSNVRALSDMIDHFKDLKQHAAMVGAVKARADIYDKMITKGQEFGFIDKVPERTEIIAGLMIKDLSNDELRAEITGAVGGLDSMLKKYGEAQIIDLYPGQIHFPDPQPKQALAVSSKPKKHRRAAVHKGRRVVKEKVQIS